MTTILRTVAQLRSHLAEHRNKGHKIGLVPTMGALHHGHLELVRTAKTVDDVVVLSIFVNPAQFNNAADLASYPRHEEQDVELATTAGVDFVFAPAPQEVYPSSFTATVALSGPLVDTLEGAFRGSGHFHGVTTVVTKLLLMVAPDHAYFGQKDAQQLRVVRALVADLNIDVDIIGVPTVREPDGLALSSRNVRLTATDRAQALGVSQGLFAGRATYDLGERKAAAILEAAQVVLQAHQLAPEYLALVDANTFHPVDLVDHTGALLAVAADVGSVRLIDNVILGAPQSPPPATAPTAPTASR